MARPLKQIDENLLEKLASIHCTMAEMANLLDCSVDTLERRYADTIKRARDKGKMSLRRTMFEKALGGNTTMMIWLSKQHLEMADKIEQKVDAKTDPELLADTERLIKELKESTKESK